MLKFANTIEEMPNAFSPRELKIPELAKFYYDGTMPVRTGSPVRSPIDDIFRGCQDSSLQNKFLLLGHRGCGKSTELNVLSRRFEEAGYPVYTVQCAQDLDMIRPLYSDLMILMGDALVKLAQKMDWKIEKKEKELFDKLVHYWDSVKELKTEISDYENYVDGGVKIETPKIFDMIFGVFASMKSSVKLGEQVRKEYESRIDNRLGEWINILNLIADRIAEKAGDRQPIIIFEELDKLADIDAEQDKKDKSWDLFFNRPSALTSFSFPVIYTFPIALSYEPRFGALKGYFQEKFFPMIKVTRMENNERCEEGFEAIRAIIEKRAKKSLFDDGVEDYLIEKTGGALRDLFDAIRQSAIFAVRREAETISKDDAVLALEEIKSEITRRFDKKYYAFLKDIYDGNRTGISDKPTLLEMLLAGVVLEYNGTRWNNLHPLVADYMEDIWRREEEQKKRQELKAEGTASEA